ncbi:hypothetical protein GC175_07005 [bacterium]|nr:hypothetical protein [bacterium]
MLQPLTSTQSQWVDRTLAGLTLQAAVGQLLCISQFNDNRDYWLPLLERLPFGAARARSESAEDYRSFLAELQTASAIPLLVPANMEHGAAEMRGYGTDFPWPMGIGAADDETLTATVGKAIALEARYLGVNWLFNPVIDLNYNPENPITNIRALGDDPVKVSRLATIWLQAMQEHGVAATAKHFPGDGIDDRDQHLLTSVNSLPFEQWMETFGVVWKAVIEAGVMCVMPGHISLPDYQGYQDRPEDAPPATLSRKLLVNLLREEMGYDGLIVSDNASMIGLTAHLDAEDQVVESIASGIDIYLNADPEHDYDRLLQAVHTGRVSEERIYDAARRVLEMKARLNLFASPQYAPPTQAEQTTFHDAARSLAEKSMTILRGAGEMALNLHPGDSVLTVTIGHLMPHMGVTDLDTFDSELSARGFEVTHLLNPSSDEVRQAVTGHAAVFVNLLKIPVMPLGTTRMTDTFRTWGWRSLYRSHPQVAYTSFGSPYVGYELPAVPRLLAAYGDSTVSQQAAVRVWLGEIEANGALPVKERRVEIRAM